MIIDTTIDRNFASARASATRRPALLLATVCGLYLAAVVGGWIFLRLQGDQTWIGTLGLLLPRWPWLLPALVLLPLTIARRRWYACVMTLAAVVFTLGPVMGFRVALPSLNEERGDCRILCLNVHRKQVDLPSLVRLIEESHPDVIAFQDWTEANDGIFEGTDWNIRREGELLVASRFPLGPSRALIFPDRNGAPKAERGAAAIFDIHMPQGTFHLVNIHFASPHTGLLSFRDDDGAVLEENIDRRWTQSGLVRDAVELLGGPVLLVGDFNTTDDSPILREHWPDVRDAFDLRGWGLGWTYLNTHTQIRIDHILVDSHWDVKRFWLEPRIGSPHRPLLADVSLRVSEVDEFVADSTTPPEAEIESGR